MSTSTAQINTAPVKKRAARKTITYSNARKSSANADAATIKAPRVKKNGEAHKARRYRPGTLANRQVNFYQKTSGSLLPRAPMIKMIREVMAKAKKELGFDRLNIDEKSKNMFIEYIGTNAVNVLRSANTLAVRVAGRKTVFKTDLETSLRIRSRGF